MFRGVSGDFFTVMGIRLLRGRGLTRADVERQYPVVVISDEFARQFFPGEDPIGRRVASNRPPGADFEWLEIVGVAANMPTRALNETRLIPILYLPMSIAATPQNPLRGASVMVMSYVLRTGRTTTELLPMIRQVIGKLDRNLALAQARSLDDILARAAAQTAFTMVLIALAGGIALLLGVIGIYGVMSYIVSQRTGEIGVRLALGAAPGAVATQILRQGSFVALAGVAIGVAVALAGSRVMTSLLFGVSARDPLVFAGTAAVLMIVALLACWLPARRAARLNPIDALRT
jgi:putative ABC transport system permease protein